MNEKNGFRIKLSTFLIISIIYFLIIVVLVSFMIVIYKDNLFCVEQIENMLNDPKHWDYKLEADLEKTQEELKTTQEELKSTQEKLREAENEIWGLQRNSENFTEKKDESGFLLGYYSYDYDVIINENNGDSWKMKLGLSIKFEENNKVYASLAGHESGSFCGTYELFDDSIKCVFTEYANECSGTFGQKIDKEELILRRANDRQLTFFTHNGKTESEEFDIDSGDRITYTYVPSEEYIYETDE